MAGNTIPSSSDNGGAWGFSTKDAGRIAQTVRRIEGQYYNAPPERFKYLGLSGLVPAKLIEALDAGTLASPTHANANLLGMDGDGPGLTDVDGVGIVVYNLYGTAVETDKLIWCIFTAGNWFLVQADC